MAGVSRENLCRLGVPAFVLGEQDGPPTEFSVFMPLSVGRDDRVRDHAALDRLFDRREIVLDLITTVALVARNPAIPAATDDPPIPFAVRVVCGEWLALSIEVLVTLSVFAIPVIRSRESEPGEAFAALVETVVRVLTCNDPLQPTKVTLDFGLGHIEGVADVGIDGDAFVIGFHLAVDEGSLH